MDRVNVGFGGGKRICLRRHVAEMEVKKCVARLVQEFDVSTVPLSFPPAIIEYSLLLGSDDTDCSF